MTTKSSLCHHEEKQQSMKHDGGAMFSVTQFAETLRQILEEEANELAKETGFVQRERSISGADFAQTLIFGWLQEPEGTLGGRTQTAHRPNMESTPSACVRRLHPQ